MATQELKAAVHLALAAGAVGSLAPAQVVLAQTQPNAAPAAELQEVTVTGSRIRRVDAETASPVFVLDRAQIEQSGITTLADLLQSIPSISGAGTNGQVNNGGGTGEANIDLRGMGPNRTLILLDGRRISIYGRATDAIDVNMIPANLIDHVEVLKEGAGAVYGSDAIGGVVNFITRKADGNGEVGYEYGISGKHDGKRHILDLSWSSVSDKGSFLVGGNYNKQEKVSSGDRKFSKYATYFYGTSVFNGGSSRTPNGAIFLPAAAFNANYRCAVHSGNIKVTRIAGAAGSALTDYRCFVGGGPNDDHYNYQAINLILTPQERGAMFMEGTYKVNDSVELYSEAIYNRTHSGFAIAELPFDSRLDNVIVSKNSVYNPFGINFGGISAVNTEAEWRMKSLGQRKTDAVTDNKLANVGARGKLFGTGWDYDATLHYSRSDQTVETFGYLFRPGLSAAFGPSFYAGPGQTNPTCGTALVPIAGCTPVDIFNLTAPGQATALGTIASSYKTVYAFQDKGFGIAFNGDVVQLPAGALKASVGYEYDSASGAFETDFLSTDIPPLNLTCFLASETCSKNSRGVLSSNNGYAEAFIPILKDMPGVKALNVDIGIRYSSFSLFNSATTESFKLEYRPVSDLLIRGTWSKVFRTPTIYNLYQGATNNSAQVTDACINLTAAKLTANPNLAKACQFVVPNTGFQQANSQITGLLQGNPNVKPETGHVITGGFVYDASWLPGFSFTFDYWKYSLDQLITQVDTQVVMDQCAATGQAVFCNGIVRNMSDGQIQVMYQPWVNLGTLDSKGQDFGLKYRLPNTFLGAFNFSLDVTHTQQYLNVPAPGAAAIDYAGTYNRQFGNYAKFRAMFATGWAYEGFSALFVSRFIGGEIIRNANGINPGATLHVPQKIYADLNVGYNFATKTKVSLGILNGSNTQPPIMYQNNVLNSNTDTITYDTIGRRMYVGVNQKF